MKIFPFQTFKSSYTDVTKVIEQMQDLNHELFNTNLNSLIPFNTTYLIITQKVYEHIGKRYFSEDESMQKFDICFATYYFNALHSYVTNNRCDPAWKLLFDPCPNNSLLQTQYMALGVNAHVNNDLAFALYETFKNREYYNDYQKINIIINQSIPIVLDSIREPFIVNFLKKWTLPIYHPLLYKGIKNWRNTAWQNYQTLETDHKNAKYKIIANAYQTAKLIALFR